MILKISKKLLVFFIILAVSVLVFLYVFNPLPKRASSEIEDIPTNFVIDTSANSFPKQGRNQCSAFSSAFILRQLGYDVIGEDIYENIGGKIMIPPWKGYVFYTGIIKLFESYGHDVNILTGNLKTLQNALTKGVPIIVLIGDGFKWQHYMVFIGYNQELKELYFYDSNKKTDTNEDAPGNRTLQEESFLKLWNNGTPLFNKCYFVVEQ